MVHDPCPIGVNSCAAIIRAREFTEIELLVFLGPSRGMLMEFKVGSISLAHISMICRLDTVILKPVQTSFIVSTKHADLSEDEQIYACESLYLHKI